MQSLEVERLSSFEREVLEKKSVKILLLPSPTRYMLIMFS